jgi:hypothetical protein
MAWPRLYLCPSARGRGKRPLHISGALAKVLGRIASSTVAGMPMSATVTAPQWLRPGMSRWPGLRRKKVTVSCALTAMPLTAPVAPSMPEGMSAATKVPSAALSAAMTAASSPVMSRASPAP